MLRPDLLLVLSLIAALSMRFYAQILQYAGIQAKLHESLASPATKLSTAS